MTLKMFFICLVMVVAVQEVFGNYDYSQSVDSACISLYKNTQTNENQTDHITINELFDNDEQKWLVNEVAKLKVEYDYKGNAKQIEHTTTTIPLFNNFISEVIYSKVIPNIKDQFSLPSGVLGIKRIFFQFHNEQTSLRKKNSLSLATVESGDYNFIIPLSVDYTGGGVRFVHSSETPDFDQDGVVFVSGEDRDYESFHDSAETTANEVSEEENIESAVEPEGTVHLSLGQAAVFTSHIHYEVNSVLSGQMLFLVGHLSIGSTTACDVHNARNPRERARQDQVALNWVMTLVGGIIGGAILLLVGLDWLEKRRNVTIGSGVGKKKEN